MAWSFQSIHITIPLYRFKKMWTHTQQPHPLPRTRRNYNLQFEHHSPTWTSIRPSLMHICCTLLLPFSVFFLLPSLSLFYLSTFSFFPPFSLPAPHILLLNIAFLSHYNAFNISKMSDQRRHTYMYTLQCDIVACFALAIKPIRIWVFRSRH